MLLKRLLISVLCFCFLSAFGSNYYSTTFSGTENPISEGGAWGFWGGTTGLLWTDVRCTPSLGFGTQDPGGTDFKDSLALLSGTWGNVQWAKSTYHRVASDSVTFEEVELLFGFSISANDAHGYELTFSAKPTGTPGNTPPYVQFNRWNGGLGDFSPVAGGASIATIPDGCVLGGTWNGSTHTLKLYTNGVLVGTGSDSTYSSGRPGIGFYSHTGTGGNANFGFTSFTAADADPIIVTQPQSTSVTVGQNAVFAIVADGFTALSYQWKFNGSNVGSNSSTYTRNNCQLSDSGGSVTCVVSNSGAQSPLTSSTATLTVNASSSSSVVSIGAGTLKIGNGSLKLSQ